MDPNINQTLREVLGKVEENNKLLKKVHKSIVWARAMRIFYWTVIILVSLGSYYFIQPYINNAIGAYRIFQSDVNVIKGGAKTIQNAETKFPDFSSFLKNFRK